MTFSDDGAVPAHGETTSDTPAVPPASVYQTAGACPICEIPVDFIAYGSWFRDFFACATCGSLPRERAIMLTIDRWFTSWRTATLHESSPSDRAISRKFARECAGYIPSQFHPERCEELIVDGVRNEDLEHLRFGDESIDLHVTQDVFEHVLDPGLAFREIARTLRPGGMHIFTTPLVNKTAPSLVRARRRMHGVEYLAAPAYHGNPVGDGRALVTVDWGYDIARIIYEHSGLFTHILHFDDLEHGLRAEYLEVLVTLKPDRTASGANA
jgi:SAM-dependent methyltransferase